MFCEDLQTYQPQNVCLGWDPWTVGRSRGEMGLQAGLRNVNICFEMEAT
ncbi:hypothetical protein CYB_0938 [Synechococcus sp. JA-2-3B'a(2-13)]|nr:hypothetical protein CYB_0938 [Synechococcus sp. JA-2-3B'a(2-13)]